MKLKLRRCIRCRRMGWPRVRIMGGWAHKSCVPYVGGYRDTAQYKKLIETAERVRRTTKPPCEHAWGQWKPRYKKSLLHAPYRKFRRCRNAGCDMEEETIDLSHGADWESKGHRVGVVDPDTKSASNPVLTGVTNGEQVELEGDGENRSPDVPGGDET